MKCAVWEYLDAFLLDGKYFLDIFIRCNRFFIVCNATIYDRKQRVYLFDLFKSSPWLQKLHSPEPFGGS